MKQHIWYVLAAILVIGAVWFGYKHHVAKLDATNPIKIGALLSLTGAAASFGEPAKNSMQLAVDDINAHGGINGRPVELFVEDDHTDPKEAISAFQKLTSVDGVDGIVGGLFDFTVKPLFPLADNQKITLISPTNFRISGSFEPTANTFVMLPEFSSVIRELTTFLQKNNTKKLAVVHFESDFGEEIAKTLSSVMTGMGKVPVIDESYKQIGGNDFSTTILKLKAQGVDTVFLDMVDVDPVSFVTRANELNYHPTIISYHALVDAFSAPGQNKSLMEGAVIFNWELSSDQFTSEYTARFSAPPSHSADKSYQATYALAEAIAATQSHADVAPYLESHIITTPFGNLQFNTNHAVDSTTVHIGIVKNGQVVDWTGQ